MATIKSFSDFNLDDILISEDYKAVDSADEENLDNYSPSAVAADVDDGSGDDPDYENDFEEQSEYAGSPQVTLKQDAQKLNGLINSGDIGKDNNDTYNEYYEDDYHDTSTMILEAEDQRTITDASSLSSHPATLASNSVLMSTVRSASYEPAPIPASVPVTFVPAVNTTHKGVIRKFSSNYFVNPNAKITVDIDVGGSGSGSGPETAVNMMSMPTQPNFGNNFSPPPVFGSSTSIPIPGPISRSNSEDQSASMRSNDTIPVVADASASIVAVDASVDENAASRALRVISANSTSISRHRQTQVLGRSPLDPKVSRVLVAKADCGLQGLLDQDASKKEKTRRAGAARYRASGYAAAPSVNPITPVSDPLVNYTAKELLRDVIRKEGKTRVRAANAAQVPEHTATGMSRELLALVSDLVDARVAQRMREAESKHQFLNGVSRQAVLVPSSSARPSTGFDAVLTGTVPISSLDSDTRYRQEYRHHQQQFSLHEAPEQGQVQSQGNNGDPGPQTDMVYRNSYDFTTITSPRISVATQSTLTPPPLLVTVSAAAETDVAVGSNTPSSDVSTIAPTSSMPVPMPVPASQSVLAPEHIVTLSVSADALRRYGTAAETIYAGFLTDIINACKKRASGSCTHHEMVMHRCLAERLFAHFGSDAEVLSYRDAMVSAAAAFSQQLSVER